MTDLKPCPLCQSEAATGIVKHFGRSADTWADGSPIREEHFCNCIHCGLRSVGFKTRYEAIAHWNRRAPVAVTDAMVAAAFHAYARCELDEQKSMRAALEAAMKETP